METPSRVQETEETPSSSSSRAPDLHRRRYRYESPRILEVQKDYPLALLLLNQISISVDCGVSQVSLELIMSQSGSGYHSDFEGTESQPAGECVSQRTGPKLQVRFNSSGQPVDTGSAQYVSFIGKMARLHCPPTYADWPSVPEGIKKHLWETVSDVYDLTPGREVGVLLKAYIAWKSWKYRLHKLYDEYSSNAERMENIPKHTKKEDWERFIEISSTDEERIKREKGKSSREHMKLPHTSGRHGCARIEDDLIKESPDGKVTRTQLFVATHTSKDGSCFPAVKPTLDEIKRLVSLDPFLGDKDLDNDPVAKVLGRDGKGRVRGLGTGVSKTVIHAAAPYKQIAEEEKRKRETTDENFRLVMQRLDEDSKARKILEEKLEAYMRDQAEFENSSQARRQSPIVDEESHVTVPFGRCLLKNFKRKSVALGSVSSDFNCTDSYSITIDDIFDYTTELYAGEGTLGDVSIGDTIKWPKTFVEPI